jgi:hypothetical protein
MNKKHINKFPVGTLVTVEEKSLGVTIGEIYGIVVAHTTLNIEILLSKPIHGMTRVTTSPRLVKSVQRPYKKPKVQQP